MRIQELSVGNYVLVPAGKLGTYEWDVITEVNEDRISVKASGQTIFGHYLPEQVKPMPITTNWLQRFRFIYDEENKYWEHEVHGIITLEETNEGYICSLANIIAFEHVHTLQNYFLAVTGEPLV